MQSPARCPQSTASTMRLHAFLVLACYVLHARAAAVPKLDVSDLQKKLAAVAEEAAKKEVLPLETPTVEKELTEQETSINEVQNNLKRGKIPVKVIVEDVKPAPVENLDDVSLDDGADIKRVEIDLKNPGPPQRQEHETQNPEHFEEPAISIKQTVDSAQAALKQGFQGVSQGIQDWVANNEQINNIQQGIQTLQDNFKEQLSKLNQTVQSFLPKPNDPVVEPVDPPQQKAAAERVQISLETLENSFQRTVQTLTEGVQAYALLPPTLRQAAEGAAGSGTTGGASGGSQGTNIFVQYLQNLQSTISQGFANVTTAIQNTLSASNSGNGSNNTFAGPGSFISGIGSGIQNIFNQNSQSSTSAPAAGAQSDEAGSTTARPNWPILQSIQSSLQNILNAGQNQAQNQGQASQPATPGPIAQAIQNNPIVQAVGNFIQPNRPGAQQPSTQAPAVAEAQASQPAESAQSADAQSTDAQPEESAQEGTNEVPASDSRPESTEEKQPEVVEGPIKKIIQNNPIMKGISGAVQRIQALGNPDKPRDTLGGEAPDQEKGLFAFSHGGGHGGGHGGANSGDSDDSDRSSSGGQVVKSESAKEPESMPKEPKEDKESTAEPAKTE